MDTADKFMFLIFGIVLSALLVFASFMISKEHSAEKYCSLNNGSYAKGLCFKNELLVRIK
jgi:hypothetical protein